MVEIASNDGYLLQYFKELGIEVLGVEPSANVALVRAEKADSDSMSSFFGAKRARLLADSRQADLIIANNVFAHVPDVHDFAEGHSDFVEAAWLGHD